MKILWLIFSVIERVYWYVWRNQQMEKFQSYGDNVWISRHCTFVGPLISFGTDVFVGEYCMFQSSNSKISIGNHVMFGPGVAIHGGDHRTDVVGRYMKDIKSHEKLESNDKDVVIENDVWVGAEAIILKGVRIGQGSIVGAGSIITKDIPPYSVVTGCKQQSTRMRWDPETIATHKSMLKIR